MLDFFLNIDSALFLFINFDLSSPITDFIMPIITSDTLLRIIYVVIIAGLLWRGDRRLRWLVLFSALTLLLTDQISSNLLKSIITRPRPCHVMDQVHLLVNCGAGFSMPSSHAANLFGQAALFYFHVRRLRWFMVGLALLVAISRVFVGVHYPGDVIVGGLLGCLIGYAVAVSFDKLLKKE